MTPAARVAAAIDILDQINTGQPTEQTLTRWGRQNRFAGSKDRAAIRDAVFDVMRLRRTAAHAGKGTDGRSLMIGLLRLQGADLDSFFTGEGHAPPALSPAERDAPGADPEKPVRWNLQDWMVPELERSLGDNAEATALALQHRAPVTLRVNRLRSDAAHAIDTLAAEGIATVANPQSPTALTVTEGTRKLRNATAYSTGLVELQDASSQAVVDLLPPAARQLDYCAGGGGKTLALAARGTGPVFAHDINVKRMADLPQRAARAGVTIKQLPTAELASKAPFDLVLCDAPCSGSGAWRRAPEGKWTLTPDRLDELVSLQDDILNTAAQLVAEGGWLVYATCSVFRTENEDRVAAFLEANPGWTCRLQKRFDVSDAGDGFFTAHLTQV